MAMNESRPRPRSGGDVTARSRRLSASINVGIYLVAFIVVAVLVNILAAKIPVRFDGTRLRQFSLSPRTQSVLDQLDQDIELTLITSAGDMAPRLYDDFIAVLRRYDDASPRIAFSVIDAADATSAARFDAQIERLKTIYAEPIAEATARIDEAVRVAEGLPTSLSQGYAALAGVLREVQQASDSAQAVSDSANLLTNGAEGVRQALEFVRRTMDPDVGDVPIPDYDAARVVLARALQDSAQLMGAFAQHYEQLVMDQGVTPTGRGQFRTMAEQFRTVADRAAVAADRLRQIEPLEISEVVRDMQTSSYLMVTGARRATVTPLTALFPVDPVSGERDRFAGEEAISTVVASLTLPEPPMVVFLHAEQGSLFGAGTLLASASQRLSGQRIRLAEWTVAESPVPPDLPFPDAPRVYVVLPPSDLSERGIVRLSNLTTVVSDLIAEGARVLYHVPPSTLPGAGQPDIALEVLEPLGLAADSGRMLVRRESSPMGPVIEQTMTLRSFDSDHPIALAVSGLPTTFLEVCALTIDDAPAGTAAVVAAVEPNGESIWAEQDWFAGQWQDATRDAAQDDLAGPWPVLAAVERTAADGTDQRIVIVAARPVWFRDDLVTQTRGNALANPGNLELLDACVYWLAGLDALVKPGATATETPRIAVDAPATAVGWFVIVILPVAALTTGVVLGILRRR
jgi:hypothetical protein